MPVVAAAAAVTAAAFESADALALAWITLAAAEWASRGINEMKDRMLIVGPPADEYTEGLCVWLPGLRFMNTAVFGIVEWNGFKVLDIPPQSIMA